ncbi:MAG TPA: hypothetical protein VLA58_05935 [Chitinophagaceae bacterium]|nr:hypothetical protein [Chitinophagaceae bacterium]
MWRIVLITAFFLAGISSIQAQYSQLEVKNKDTAKKEYPYIFPILGKKAVAKGFNIPLPAGIMLNTFFGNSDITISNLQLGVEGTNVNVPLTPVEFIEFGKNTATVKNVNIRPDLWVLPFMNVYGILGYTEGKTSVSLTAPVPFNAVADLKGYTYGFGTTFAGGVGKYFIVGDFNWAWSAMDILDKPAASSITSFRFGRNFQINNQKDKLFGVWAGLMKFKLASGTQGKVTLGDVIPPEVFARKDEIVADYYEWYNNLGNNPVDQKKKEIADKVLTPIVEGIDARDGSTTVSYSLEKKPTKKWNMIVGGQYQFNKRWQLRTEFGFFGGRSQGLFSANYRFGL